MDFYQSVVELRLYYHTLIEQACGLFVGMEAVTRSWMLSVKKVIERYWTQ
jgi:hypothetical protein